MGEERKENVEEKDVNIDSLDFKAGYHHGFLDGIEAMSDRITKWLKDIDQSVKTFTNDGK